MQDAIILGRRAHALRFRKTLKHSPAIELDAPIEDTAVDSLRELMDA